MSQFALSEKQLAEIENRIEENMIDRKLKIVRVAGVGNIAFPDTMPDKKIAEAIRKHLAQIANAKRAGGR